MNSSIRITIHPDAVFTRLGPDSATVLNLATKRYYTLSGTGLRIWELIECSDSSHEIARALNGEYSVELDTAHERVISFVGELQSEGLVETN